MKNITEVYCIVDDFCKSVDKEYINKLIPREKKATREAGITESEIITILIIYHQSPCKNFKSFYLHYLKLLYKLEFPKLPSYSRFIQLKPRALWYLALLLQWYCEQAKNTGISYIDSTAVAVCHAKRISRNKVFAGIAKICKSAKGWFFGFKLHVVINDIGEIQGVKLTKGNVDDRKPVEELTKKLKGMLFGDKGYIKETLFRKLFDRGLKLITRVKKSMKSSPMLLKEKILLRKRSIIETVFDYFKNKLELEHSRHPSPMNFLLHILSTLLAYSFKKNKPSISPL